MTPDLFRCLLGTP